MSKKKRRAKKRCRSFTGTDKKLKRRNRNIEEKNQDVPKKSKTEEVKNDKSTEGVLTK